MATRKKKTCKTKNIQRVIHDSGYIGCPDCGYRRYALLGGQQYAGLDPDPIHYAFLGEHHTVKRPTK